MDVKYHVGGMEVNSGVWMGDMVVKHLVDGEVGFLGCFCLLVCNCTKGHEKSDVNALSIVQNGTDYLLDFGDTFLVESWRFIN